VEPLDGPAKPRQDGIGQLVRAHGRDAGRLEAERRPEYERRSPWATWILRRDDHPETKLETPRILQDQA